MTKLKFTKSTADIYASNKLQKKGWVSINDGYIYIARDNGRSYWLFRNIPPEERPVIHFNDKTKTIRIGTNKIVIKSPSKYIEAKNNLEPYSKNPSTIMNNQKKNDKKVAHKRETKKRKKHKKEGQKRRTKKKDKKEGQKGKNQYVKNINNSELRKYGLGPNNWYYKN